MNVIKKVFDKIFNSNKYQHYVSETNVVEPTPIPRSFTYAEIQAEINKKLSFVEHLEILSQIDAPNYDGILETMQQFALSPSLIKIAGSQGFKDYLTKLNAQTELNRINELKIKYPLCKLIRTDDLNVVCRDYELYVGETRNFIGEIPQENLSEISRFKLKDEDKAVPIQNNGWWIDNSKFPQIIAPKELFSNQSMISQDVNLNLDPIYFQRVKYCNHIKVDILNFHPDTRLYISCSNVELQAALIVSTWGNETEIPGVFNEQLN